MGGTTTVVAVTTAFSTLATIFVVLRLISRMRILRKTSIDDHLIVLAIIFSWFQAGSILAQAHFGVGKHIQDISIQNFSKLLLALWIGLPLYNLALALAKVSALCQLLRFITGPRTRTFALVLVAVVSSFGIAISITSILSCHPIDAFWSANPDFTLTHCIDLRALWYSNVGFNIGTDIAVVALPLYVLRDLRTLPRIQRWGFNTMFVVGGTACITSILLLYAIYRGYHSFDYTYILAEAETWRAVEVNTAIICACMQSLKPLLGKVSPIWRTQRRTANNASTSSSSTAKARQTWRSKLTKSKSTSSTTENTMTGLELNGASYFGVQDVSDRPGPKL